MTSAASNVSAVDGRSTRFAYSDKVSNDDVSYAISYKGKKIATHHTIWLNQWWCNNLGSDIQYSKGSAGYYFDFKAAVSADGTEYRFSAWQSNYSSGVAEASINIKNSVSGTGICVAYWN